MIAGAFDCLGRRTLVMAVLNVTPDSFSDGGQFYEADTAVAHGLKMADEGADMITFTSSSTVENFLALGLPWPQGMLVASIGPITSRTARDRGLTIAVEAPQHDVPGLVEAIRKFFAPA